MILTDCELLELLKQHKVTIRSYQWYSMWPGFKAYDSKGNCVGDVRQDFLTEHILELHIVNNTFTYTEYAYGD